MKKIVLTIVALLIGFGLVTSTANFGFSTTPNEVSSQGQGIVSQSESQSEPTDSENSETALSTNIQNEQLGEETPSEVVTSSEEQRAVPPQQMTESLKMSSQLSSSTVNELTQELESAIADIKDRDPTAANISIKCTITYPPFKIVCEISWLSTPDSTPTE